MTGVSIVTVTSVCNFESKRSSRKFSRMIRFVMGSLVFRIGAFHSNHAVNPFSQLSASVMDISWMRGPLGFNVLSKRCGLGEWENEVWSGTQYGLSVLSICSYWTSSTSAKGDVWLSGADSSVDAVDDLDCVCECRCRWSSTCTVSHVGSLNPRMRLAQQKSEIETSSVRSFSRNYSMASRDCSRVTSSWAI